MELSVVIITRNEEAAIGPCLESVLKQTEGLEREIILVDSASTDRTVEIAGKYPVTIVRIDACTAYSPAAGRYVGTKHATGRCILFLDGDNVLIEGWLESALAQLQNDTVAAIAGQIYRVFPGEEPGFAHQDKLVPGDALYLPTAGMYRRDVLQQVGSFNPFVRGEEERELGFRIRQAGYTIRQEALPMIFHVLKSRTRSELEEKAGYFTGVGQVFRRYGLRSITCDLLARHRQLFATQMLIFLGACLAVVFLVTGQFWLLVAELAGVGLGLLALSALKGWTRVYLFLGTELLKAGNIGRGFGRGIPDHREFKAETSVLSRLAV